MYGIKETVFGTKAERLALELKKSRKREEELLAALKLCYTRIEHTFEIMGDKELLKLCSELMRNK